MKKNNVFYLGLAIGLLFIHFSAPAQVQTTRVAISGIRSGKGQIILNVFKDNDTYDKEQPFRKLVFDKKELSNGLLTVDCPLEKGIYGITLVDDENENGKIDRSFIGKPTEGFGFSNFYLTKNKKPSFDDFKVEVKGPGKVDIKVKYM